MSVIKITNLSFRYDGGSETIFDDVSFQFDTNWKLGFVGRNGRGKTTFLRLLLGELEYRGTISHSVEFEYFPYEVSDTHAATLDALLTIAPDSLEWEFQREFSLLGLAQDTLNREFCTLSSGEQTKALLAALFLKQNCFLLIDEPTNHLDAEGRLPLMRYLNGKQGFLVVSHDRAFLDGCTDHTLAINRADIQVRQGNFSVWWENKRLEDEFQAARNEKLQRDVNRLQVSADRAADWSHRAEKAKFGKTDAGLKPDRGYMGHKAAKMMQRAKAIETRRNTVLEEKQSLLKNVENSGELAMFPLYPPVERLAELRDVSVRYGGHTACSGVSFTVERGERVALTGRNGCGKSSILKLICGQALDYSGVLRTASGLVISYVPQGTAELSGSLSQYARNCGVEEHRFKAILRKLDFSREQFDQNAESLSGGQKKKVLLARSLAEEAHLYVWDEPLNFIDVISRIQLEELILEFRPTLIFVEHDDVFRAKIATKIINFGGTLL